MAEKIDEKKMRRELIGVYNEFLNQTDKEISIDKAIRYDRRYGGLVSDHYIKYIPKDIAQAIGGLSVIYQYGMRPNDPGYSNDEITSKAKQILENLKNSE